MLAVGGPDPRARKQPLQRFFFSPQLILQFTGRHIRSNETCLSPRGGGRGGTLIFLHIRRLGPFYWVQNSEFQYFLGLSGK